MEVKGMERKVLGKGISALIPEKEVSADQTDSIINVDISKVIPSKYQPRELFNREKLDELASSIKEKGVVQPLLVRERQDGTYELIAGERRLRAARELGLEKVPVIVRKVDSDVDLLELSLIENIQREDLNAIEEAHAYQRLMDEFQFNLDDIGKAVGKDKSSISNTTRLLKLPPKIQELISAEQISMGHGRALLSIENPKEQMKLCNKIIKKGLSVRETESLVNIKVNGSRKGQAAKDDNIAALEDELQQIFGTRVKLMHAQKRGRIQIEYFSLDEFERILGLLRKCKN